MSLWKRPAWRCGDFFDGTVLLLPSPLVGVAIRAGLLGVVLPSWRECLDEVDRFLLSLPSRRTLSAPALALEADLAIVDFRTGFGVVGPLMGGVPFSISFFVCSSAPPVPCMPMRKWS